MTATPSSPSPHNGHPARKTSGNPARQAQLSQAAAKQREQERQDEIAGYRKQLTKRRRSTLAWWSAGSLVAVGVIAAVIASIVFAPTPPVTLSPGIGDGSSIQGVETFKNSTDHVEGTVDYPQTPPTGGDHNVLWLNCGVYTDPQQNEYAVHSLEHGAVWITYDADAVSAEDLASLEQQLPTSYILLSPYEGLDSPLVMSAWDAQLKLDTVDDPRVSEFLTAYWRSQNTPEPNAACSGAVDGPGKR